MRRQMIQKSTKVLAYWPNNDLGNASLRQFRKQDQENGILLDLQYQLLTTLTNGRVRKKLPRKKLSNKPSPTWRSAVLTSSGEHTPSRLISSPTCMFVLSKEFNTCPGVVLCSTMALNAFIVYHFLQQSTHSGEVPYISIKHLTCGIVGCPIMMQCRVSSWRWATNRFHGKYDELLKIKAGGSRRQSSSAKTCCMWSTSSNEHSWTNEIGKDSFLAKTTASFT